MNIDTFYLYNKVSDDFDEKAYLELCSLASEFYQPYCKDNNISEKHRLFFHYIMYWEENLKPPKKISTLQNINFVKVLIEYANKKQDLELLDIIKNNSIDLLYHDMRNPIVCEHISHRIKLLDSLDLLIDYFPEPNIQIPKQCLEDI